MSAGSHVPQLRQLVMEALDEPYSSFSSTDDSETGNRYQAVSLGEFTTRGLREGRDRFLDVLDLEGKRVLDLGSNLGEISRQARARGAALVDGFEIDPYFIEIADLVNVATGTTHVSFFERDLADPDVYRERYDIVLAFSVFRFIVDRLDRLAAITDVVVLEGHTLRGNFEQRYMRRVTRWFPAYRVLGESDAARTQQEDARAVMLFARDEQSLRRALHPRLRGAGRGAGVMAAGVRSPRIRGSFDLLEREGNRLRASGWCLDPEAAQDSIELSTPVREQVTDAPRGTLGVTAPQARPDVGAALPALPHAARSGFEFDCAGVPERAQMRIDATAFRGPERLGTISAWVLDGMYDELPDPPVGLAERWWGTGDARRLALASLGVAGAMLEGVGRYRALDSFRSALDWGCGIGLLARHLARLVPGAALTGVEWDTEALAWARAAGLPGTFEEIPDSPPTGLSPQGFELVVGHGVLPRRPPDGQAALLDELHRLTAPGGYVALTSLGELALRFLADGELAARVAAEGAAAEAGSTYQTKLHTIALCSERFDVVSYVEGGVAGLHDLIVLRRP